MRLATWVFGGGALLFQAELYIGLAVFSGYIVYDTQVTCTVLSMRCECAICGSNAPSGAQPPQPASCRRYPLGSIVQLLVAPTD